MKIYFNYEGNSPRSQEGKDICRRLIPKEIVKDEVNMFKKNVTLEEIHKAISTLNNEKSPGPNGLLVAFYKENKEWISEDLLQV